LPEGNAPVPRRFRVLANPDSSKLLFLIDTAPLLFQLCRKAEPPLIPSNPFCPLIVTDTLVSERGTFRGVAALKEVKEIYLLPFPAQPL
jgi:hypothetical protein